MQATITVAFIKVVISSEKGRVYFERGGEKYREERWMVRRIK